MRNTITLNGTASTTIAGLLIQSLPPITKPQQRTTIEEIDGRDGDIVTELGFAAYDKEITIGLYGTFDINQVIAYFNSEGTVTFSNEPDKLYNYKIINKIDFERLVRYRTATVTFHCQPFKYPTTGTSQTLDGSTVTGEGTDFYMPNTTEGVFAKFTPKGNTEQQTYTGKNLFSGWIIGKSLNATNGSETTNSKGADTDFIPVDFNNSPNYYISGLTDQLFTFAAAYNANHEFLGRTAAGGVTYLILDKNRFGNGTPQGTGDIKYLRVTTYENASLSGTIDLVNSLQTQLEAGSSGSSYEPYVGGTASPNPDYPQNINVVTGGQDILVHNKNLFKIPDTETTRNGIKFTPHADGTFDIVGTASANSEFYTVVPLAQSGIVGGGEYRPSTNSSIGTSSVRYYVHSCTEDGTWRKTLMNINRVPNINVAEEPITEYIKFVIQVTSGNTVDIKNIQFQLEAGSSAATAFKPYQGQFYEMNLGKNEVDFTTIPFQRANGGDATRNGGTFTVTSGSSANSGILFASQNLNLKPNTTYTFSGKITSTTATNGSAVVISSTMDASGNYVYGNLAKAGEVSKATFTTPSEIGSDANIRLYTREANATAVFTDLQVELGDTATSYAPYTTPLELCKIGNYQDYFYKDGDDWYLHKEIGKQVLGDLTWGYGSTNQTGIYRKYTEGLQTTILPSAINVAFNGFCTHFRAVRSDSAGTYGANTGISVGPTGTVFIYYSAYNTNTSADNTNFKTWLQDNNVVLYYALATPTDTKITNTALIEQLNAMAGASAYKSGTYVASNAATPNLPIIIHAEIASDMDATITNAGNIYARPKLTITGSGDIGVYLNGSQMFQIELGDEGEITIDTDTQEAYKGTTATLKNRLVTGDYSKFKLNPGANQLAFTGNATQCVVENYTRWL